MSDEIVIKYKTETVSKDNFTEREKAIYNSGYTEGYGDGNKRYGNIISVFVGIGVLVMIIYNMI